MVWLLMQAVTPVPRQPNESADWLWDWLKRCPSNKRSLRP